MLQSQLCSLASLTSPPFVRWAAELRPMWDPDGTDPKPYLVHRKMWEWLFICEALSERGMLAPGRRGVGFGVGREPLVALFARHGCEILATDLPADQAAAEGWTEASGEHAGGRHELNEHGLCPPADFDRLVAYRDLDMASLPPDLGTFDFSWSSCAFEHLGSLRAGLDFVVEQMRYVRPGGVSVHTTELNVSSATDTVSEGGTVLYRRSDIEVLAGRLQALGYRISLDFTEGDSPADRHVDVPPFTDTHLRTTLAEFVTTSLALVIERPS